MIARTCGTEFFACVEFANEYLALKDRQHLTMYSYFQTELGQKEKGPKVIYPMSRPFSVLRSSKPPLGDALRV